MPDDVTERDPVQEFRAHLEQALALLDRLRGVLPPPSSSPRPTREVVARGDRQRHHAARRRRRRVRGWQRTAGQLLSSR